MAGRAGRKGEGAAAVFAAFLRLGLTSFGGPVAHLAYFRDEFVARRGWIAERDYADLVALCQFLPGPASSQVGIALGLRRAGYAGALAAWAGFTLPSALALAAFALAVRSRPDLLPQDALQGLKLAAVAVVAHAVWSMARSLCRDAAHLTLMAAAACAVWLAPSALTQFAVIVGGAVAGAWIGTPRAAGAGGEPAFGPSRGVAVGALAAFASLLVVLPWLASRADVALASVVDAFYRTGSLVFGGGHVVLPLLRAEVVDAGWVDAGTFLAGYGAAQAVPGPLFTFAAFLGASLPAPLGGWTGAAAALVAIFVPSFLLVVGALPFWERWKRSATAQKLLSGVNAAVVGLLLAALYDPVWTAAVLSARDAAVALAAFVALVFWRVPAWAVVPASGMLAALLALLPP